MGDMVSMMEQSCVSNCGNKEIADTKRKHKPKKKHKKKSSDKSIAAYGISTEEGDTSHAQLMHQYESKQSETVWNVSSEEYQRDDGDDGDTDEYITQPIMDEEKKKLTNMINQMAAEMQVQKEENERLRQQLEKMQENNNNNNNINRDRSTSLKITVDQYGDDDINIKRIKSYEKNVTPKRVLETLEKSRSGAEIPTLIMSQYKSNEDVFGGTITTNPHQILSDDDDSSFDEHEEEMDDEQREKREKRKSIRSRSKEIDAETLAIQKELNAMQNMSPNSRIDGSGHLNLASTPSNLYRDGSGNKWEKEDLDRQKKEMQEHMIHLVTSHTKSKSGAQDIDNLIEQATQDMNTQQ